MQQFILIGNVCGDAVVRSTNGGKPVVNFTVADNESYTDSDGVKHEKALFYNCSIFDRDAIAPYIKKGDKIFVQGRLSAGIYTSKKDNKPAIDLSVIVGKVELLGKKEDAQPEQPQASEAAPQGNGLPSDSMPFK